MRINNPKSIVGYQRVTNADELAYNLATVGQVKKAILDLQEEILNELYGHGEPKRGISAGYGYAWLTSEGTVHPDLLPALAITDTHVIKQSDLKSAASLPVTVTNPEGGWKSEFDRLMNIWLRNEINANNKSFQKGDIIIVSVDQGETPDPVYAGSYIITYVPDVNTTGYFQLSKLAYTDGNIVKINGVAPKNSAGELRLYLSDILQERYIDKFVTATSGTVEAKNATEALEDSVYRLVTIDEGNEGYRFGFIDNSNVGQGAIIPYTKLREFNDEKDSTSSRFLAVNEAIATLATKQEADKVALQEAQEAGFAAVSERIDNETSAINDTIGKRTDAADRALSASIFAQSKALSNDLNTLSSSYLNTESLTNDMLSLIQNNVKNLHQGLEKRAVRLYMQEFIWTAEEAVLTEFDTNSAQYKYQVSASDVSGAITWTHTHSPIGTGVNNTGDFDAENVQGISNVNSEERVLAVYDENGNLVNVDMKFIKVGKFGLNDTQIIVETEFIGRDGNGKFINTLEGKKWTILLAKTISGIDINEALQNV